MSKKPFLQIFLNIMFLLAANIVTISNAGAQVSISSTLGVTGSVSYSTLKDAFAAINNGVHQGSIIVAINSNTVETGSAILYGSGSGASLYSSILIKPGGSTSVSVSGNIYSYLIDLNGASHVTIDGLNLLTIENKNPGAFSNSVSTIRMVNDASGNKIRNCKILGAANLVSGVILFSKGLVNGNSNNRIEGCMIGPSGINYPVNAIYSEGTPGAENSNDSITNCEVFDFYSEISESNGIRLYANSNKWIISGNKFYQTGSRNYNTSNTHKGIYLRTGDGYQILGNTIGYASGLGTGFYTMTSAVGSSFIAIDLEVGDSIRTSVQGNIISAIKLTSATSNATGSGGLCGIRISSGGVDVGTVSGNIIGATSGTGSIILTSTVSNGTIVGMNLKSNGKVVVRNNTIGAMQSIAAPATLASGVIGITVSAFSALPQTIDISDNTIGNATPDNMVAGVLGTTTGATVGAGISAVISGSSTIPTVLSNNIIQNISSFGSGAGYVRGITSSFEDSYSTYPYVINGNTISNLRTNSSLTGVTSGLTAAAGIHLTQGQGSVVSNNVISGIIGHNTNATNLVISGIVCTSASNAKIFKNKIYSITNAGTGTTVATAGIAAGVLIRSGMESIDVTGNMIALGAGQSSNTVFVGIYGNYGSTPNLTLSNIFNNSIHISGNVSTGSQPSFCFVRQDLTSGVVNTTPVLIKNNIFSNVRSGGTGSHYAIANNYGTSGPTVSGWGSGSSDRNVLNASSSTIGYWGGDKTYANWGNSSLGDAGSVSGVPISFVNATNDLHLNMGTTPTSLESNGMHIPGVSEDLDEDIRPGPVGSTRGGGQICDIGADEFDGVPLDLTPPIISYSNLPNTTLLSNRIINDFANITDWSIATMPGLKPRIYFKKSANLNVFAGNSSGDNGWKYVEATNTVAPFSFVLDYSLLTGGSVSVGDTIQYFVVAQDSFSHTTSIPRVGFIGASVSSVSSAPSTPNMFIIVGLPLNGNYNVGVGQTFITIKQAISNLSLRGVSGPVNLILTDALYSSSEVFPITISAYNGASSINTVTLRPNTGIASKISGSSSTAIIDLNGVSHFVIDGRQGGSGGFTLGSNLIIANANTNGPAVRFINDARSNKIAFTELRSNNTIVNGGAGAGVVNFGTTTGSNGNDSNIILRCDIHEETGGGNPRICIASIGSATTMLTNNDYNIVDSCNIYNFFNTNSISAGIYLGVNNGGWTISNNNVYQTATRNYTTAATHRGFWITPNTSSLTSASGFIINNNRIGGNTPTGAGIYQMSGSVATVFNAIDISVGLGIETHLQGNIISGISLTSSSALPNTFVGINIENGKVNVGTITGNRIGSNTTNGAITLSTTVSGGGVVGIRTAGGTNINICKNTISGIDIIGNATTVFAEFFGISLLGGTTVTVDSNKIGSTQLVNSINHVSSSATSTGASRMSAIMANPLSVGVGYNITNNTIANINTNYSAPGTQATCIKGVHIIPAGGNSVFSIHNNLVYNLSSASINSSSGLNSAIIGIAVNAGSGLFKVTQNTVHSLTLTGSSLTAAVQCEGIFFSPTSSENNIISGNFIHSLSLVSSNPNAIITGMEITNGAAFITNNMIRMGLDSNGASITKGCYFAGILKSGGSGKLYYNTIYVGGAGVANSAKKTFAFHRTGFGVDTLRNNILMNTRTNATSGAGHFAIGTIVMSQLVSDYNLLRADSIGLLGSSVYSAFRSLENWKTANKSDYHSISDSIRFVNPNGTKFTVDLHINPIIPSPIESYGDTIVDMTTDVDFDGQIRNNYTPIDLGADAGNFTSLDVVPPVIRYTPLANITFGANRIVTATITDASGIYFSGALQPRIYFKKSAIGIYTSAQGVLKSGTKTNSIWEFTIDTSAMGGLVGDDSVYYFVVAQDSTSGTGYLSSFPEGAQGANVNSITLAPVASSYKITPVINGVFNVGVGQRFESLTGEKGIFSYINTALVNGNITIRITSDLKEDARYGLNEITEVGGGSYSVKIIPDTAQLRTIIFIRNGAMPAPYLGVLRINGIDRLMIDGRYNGVGRYLRFLNRDRLATFTFDNDAHRDTIQSCIIEAIGNGQGIRFGWSDKIGGTGNDSNGIINCIIRDTLGSSLTANLPSYGVTSASNGDAGNSCNAIIGNEISNFYYKAVLLQGSSPNYQNNGNFWVIKDNMMYMTNPRNSIFSVIHIAAGSGHTISGNSIGGSSLDRSGNAFSTNQSIIGIELSAETNYPTLVRNNIISNFGITGSSGSVTPILLSIGNVSIENNIIGGGAMPYDTIRMGMSDKMIQILVPNSSPVSLKNNVISNIACYDTIGYILSAIQVSSGNAEITGNTIRNIRSYGSRPIGIWLAGGSPNIVVKGNMISDIVNVNESSQASGATGILSSVGSVIEQNRISNIVALGKGIGSFAPIVAGINVTGPAGIIIRNNQVSLGGNQRQQALVYGIHDLSVGVTEVLNNSIYINGFATLSGNNGSSGIFRSSTTSSLNIKNNIIYNKRKANGSVKGIAIASNSSYAINPADINYNLMVVADTSNLINWGGSLLGWNTMIESNVSISRTNWIADSLQLSAANLFVDTAVGDLGIKVAQPEAWYANGKGIAIEGLSGDYDDSVGVRSVSVVNGATDIGSVEFIPTSLPPLAVADKVPTPSDSTTFFFGGRRLSKIVWDTTGTLPSSMSLRYYSGHNPANVFTGSTYTNAYWDFQPTGGVAYSYNLTIMVDSAIGGKVSNIANMDIAHYNGAWIDRTNTTINSIERSMSSIGLSSIMGVFSGTDGSNNPLPIRLNEFAAVPKSDNVLVLWSTVSEIDNKGFDIERSVNADIFEVVGFVKGAGNSNRILNYSYTDAGAFTKAASRVLYYRLKQLDNNGAFTYSNIVRVENKTDNVNTVSVSPNPFTSEYAVSIITLEEGVSEIEMTDIQGRVVAKQTGRLIQGVNTIMINNIAAIQAGVYFVKVTTNYETRVIKVVKE